MNKKTITIGIMLVFLVVGLSGCTEQTNTNVNQGNSDDTQSQNNQKSDIEIYDISVITKATERRFKPDVIYSDGFSKDFSEDYMYQYIISGKVKNIGDRPIDSVDLTLTLYDSLGNKLYSTETGYLNTPSNLYMGEMEEFEFNVYDGYCEYFEYVTEYKLDYSIKYD